MKMNKIICIVCALLICIVTFGNIAITAFAASSTSDYDTTDIDINKTAEDIAVKISDYASSGGTSLMVDALAVSLDTYIDTHTQAELLVDTTANIAYYIDTSGNLCRSRSGSGGGGGRHRVDSADDIEISGETFADIIKRLNEQYAPNTNNFISYKKDKRWGNYLDDNDYFYWTSLYFEGEFCNSWSEVYLLPVSYVANTYYARYNIHLWQEVVEVDGVNAIYLNWELIDHVTKDVLASGQINHLDFATVRYFDISCFGSFDYIEFKPYASYDAYISRNVNMGNFGLFYKNNQIMYTSQQFVDMDLSVGKYFYELCYNSVANSAYDNGFLVSDKFIDLGYERTGIDPTKIDKDAIINMGGDTIYDYTITNTSGDSTTINEYVTNNYTYITNNDVPDGGNTGGDVNVKGEIAVGGEVDINVNINDNPSSMPVEVDVDNYIEVLPEQARPVTNLMKIFFDWLPLELMSLVLAGVAVAIILRIWGR